MVQYKRNENITPADLMQVLKRVETKLHIIAEKVGADLRLPRELKEQVERKQEWRGWG